MAEGGSILYRVCAQALSRPRAETLLYRYTRGPSSPSAQVVLPRKSVAAAVTTAKKMCLFIPASVSANISRSGANLNDVRGPIEHRTETDLWIQDSCCSEHPCSIACGRVCSAAFPRCLGRRLADRESALLLRLQHATPLNVFDARCRRFVRRFHHVHL